MRRVGPNHIYTVYIRYFWLGNHQIYGVYIPKYTVLANSIYTYEVYVYVSGQPQLCSLMAMDITLTFPLHTAQCRHKSGPYWRKQSADCVIIMHDWGASAMVVGIRGLEGSWVLVFACMLCAYATAP